MIRRQDIILQDNPHIRRKALEVKLPMDEETKKILLDMCEYLKVSQDEEKSKELDIEPGVGIAAPQIDVNLRMLAIDVDYGDEESRFFYGVINPKIIASSVQMTYLEGGEGCLSVPNKRGNVLRHNRVKVKATFYDPLKDTFEEKVITLRGYKAVVIQHEMDHLDGTLFIDKLAKSTSGIEPCEFI